VTAVEAAPFSVGSLVRARFREWVVLPGSDAELLMVRPLGGTDAETTGILTALEPVEPATFALPDPTQPGDYRSARLLRDALRLGFRSSAGPFRSFGHIAVEPRPYQLVPLLMALRQDPVRLLIADDVGIGKTVEAGLIARELLDQGDVQRLAVLCPPHLAEQWQAELADKFHLEATLVLAATAARLERHLPPGRSIFEEHPIVVVSLDYIKADRRRDDFLRACPKLVIIDEAHTCADQGVGGAGAHQRYALVEGLAADPERHVVLVTATPHSGKEGAFRSLLTLLDPDFANLPDDLSGDRNRRHRERLAQHLVQRRRADIQDYLGDTRFPRRMETEQTYQLSADYRSLFDKVLAYARETVRDTAGGNHRQRVRWWSALALLRSLASSPAAAAATLRTRAASALTTTVAEADDVGRRMVLDLGDDDQSDAPDVVHGADPSDDEDQSAAARTRRRLLGFAKEADALTGRADEKLVRATTLIQRMLDDGFSPIVFCRFIPTAEYLAEQLRTRLKKGTEVTAVTGTIASSEREARIEILAQHPKRVLVATDCLSEGINLQHAFDAVLHYDLPWNPTRLEQREGRVDRFGQPAPEVRVVTYYGDDNQIDEIVLEVLLRKHRVIRKALGVSIPVPGSAASVIEALTEGVLLAEGTGGIAARLPGMDAFFRPNAEQLTIEWDAAAEKEKASRSVFAQAGIQVSEVALELAEVRAAVGAEADVEGFVRTAVAAHGGRAPAGTPTQIDLAETPLALREAVGPPESFHASFETTGEGERHLSRTDPFVSGLASFVLDRALDGASDAVARRCGLVRTSAVTTRTTLVVVRYRFHLVTTKRGVETPLLAEDSGLLAWRGSADQPTWLTSDEVTTLLAAEPAANPGGAVDFLTEAVGALDQIGPDLDAEAHRRAEQLHQSHIRVRDAARQKGVRVRVEPQLPVDVLGVYVYLPAPAGAPR